MIDGYLLKQLSRTKQNLGKGGTWKRFKRLLKRQLVYAAMEGKRESQIAAEGEFSDLEWRRIHEWCDNHSLDFNERTRVVSW